ncbi:MAG: AraC family transcriptional regulator [Clostridia bacterium]|nr:AraC family transcriptional regulator [Clostridia bacterium]
MFAEIETNAAEKLPFVLMTLRNSSAQPPVDRPHGLSQHQILWVTKGTCTYRVDGKTFVLSEGEGIYMRPHVPHRYEGTDLSTAWCTFAVTDAMLDFLGVGDYLHFQAPASLNRDTEELLRLSLGDSTVLDRSTAGYTFVIDFFSAILGKEESFSSQVKRILTKCYAEPLTLTDIAEEVRTDKYTLCRLYKQEAGITVMGELMRIRVEKAKQFLKYNTASVGEIGNLCGFESPSYFGKCFRRQVGCSPTEYRKRHI